MSAGDAGILRGIELDAQPRALLRPARAGAAPHSAVPPGDAEQRLAMHVARLEAEAEHKGYAEGLARGRDDGLEEGRRQGLVEGLTEAQLRIDAALARATESLHAETARLRQVADVLADAQLQRLQRLVEAFECESRSRLEALEPDAVEAAFEAICRIVGDGTDRGAAEAQLRGLVSTAVSRIGQARLLRIRVHPDDLPSVVDWSRKGSALERHASVEWVGDAAVGPLGCIVDSDQGSLDARLDVQLARLRDAWSAAAAGSSPADTDSRVAR